MLRLSNVFKRDHPLTPCEEYILDVPKEAILSAFVIIAAGFRWAIKTSIKEIIALFTAINFVTLGLFLWSFYLMCKFLRGWFYIKKFNNAIQNGTHFEGIIIERRKKMRGWRGFRYPIYQLGVQLDNGDTIDSPVYKKISPNYQKCDVYFYQKRYFFTEFRE